MEANDSLPNDPKSPPEIALPLVPVEQGPVKQLPVKEQKFSLSRLSAAFARMAGTKKGANVSTQPTATKSALPQATEPHLKISSLSQVALSPRMIIEAMLFVGKETSQANRSEVTHGMTSEQLSTHIRDVTPSEVDIFIEQLNTLYRENKCPYEIALHSGHYQMQLLEEYSSLGERFRSPNRAYKLTPIIMEVLAIVAYRQPVTAEQVQQLRSARSHSALNQLVNRQLLKLERREDNLGKPWYRTTDRFNRLFQLQTIADLPRNEDLDDL